MFINIALSNQPSSTHVDRFISIIAYLKRLTIICKMSSGTVYDPQQKIWSGPRRIAGHDTSKSIGEYLYERMQKNPNNICQITHPEGTILTYKEVLELSIKVAQYLRDLQLTKDDVVGVIAKSSTMFLPISVGCWFTTIPFYPIYTEKDRNFIAQLFGLVRPKVIFCDADELMELQAACAMLKLSPILITIDRSVKGFVYLNEIFDNKISVENFRPTKLLDGPAQTSVYLSSSGTTGFPKCMHLSNEYLLEDTRIIDSNCVMFTFSNQNWISGLSRLYLTLLSGGIRIITTLPSDPELQFDLIEKYKITHLMTITPVCAQMVKCFAAKPRDLSSVQFLSVGGAILSTTVYQQAQKMLPNGIVGGTYGATEWGFASLNKKYHKPNAAGQLRPGFRAKIVDESGHCLGVDEVGEILLHNGCNWKGYVGNAKETALMQDADGWFHTGDLGYFDADADLFIIDRKKDVLKFRGVDYTPFDIEQIVVELPDVIEVCAFGIKDDIDVDRPAVALILKSGSKLTKLDIKQYVASKLPHHMHLHGGVYFVKDFPRTDSGKISRRAVRDLITLELTKQNKIDNDSVNSISKL